MLMGADGGYGGKGSRKEGDTNQMCIQIWTHRQQTTIHFGPSWGSTNYLQTNAKVSGAACPCARAHHYPHPIQHTPDGHTFRLWTACLHHMSWSPPTTNKQIGSLELTSMHASDGWLRYTQLGIVNHQHHCPVKLQSTSCHVLGHTKALL